MIHDTPAPIQLVLNASRSWKCDAINRSFMGSYYLILTMCRYYVQVGGMVAHGKARPAMTHPFASYDSYFYSKALYYLESC